MGKLTKNDVFQIKPLHHIEKVKGRGEFAGLTFGIKIMTAGDKEDYELSMLSFEESPDGALKPVPVRKDNKLRLLVRTVCDPDTGELLFTPDDIPTLRGYSGKALQNLFDAAARLNELRAEKGDAEAKN